MNQQILILLLIYQLVGCSKAETKVADGQPHIKIQRFLNYADSDTELAASRLEYNQKAFHLIQQLPDDSTKTKYLFKIANRYFNNSDFVRYKVVCDYLLINAALSKDSTSLAKAYEYYGDYYQTTTSKDSAFYYYGKAEKLYLKLNNTEKAASLSLNEATVLLFSEDYYGAETAALKALNYYKNTHEHRKIFESYTLLGNVAMGLQDYNASLRYFNIALSIARQYLQNDLEHPISLIYNNIGAVHINSGRPEIAIDTLIIAFNDADLINENPYLYAIITDNLAHAKSQVKENAKEVLKLYERSLKIKSQLIDTSSHSFTKVRLAEYLLSLGDSIGARTLSHEVLAIANKYKDTTDSNMALKVLMLADPENSASYAKTYLKNSETQQKSERKVKNKFARIKFDTDQIIDERENAIKQKWIVLGAALLIILVIILLHMIRVQNGKHTELKLLQAQQSTNEEIYTLILEQQNQVDAGREKEKRRIARDLHDGVMNKLTSTRLNLDILNTRYDLQTINKCLPYISGIQDIEKEIRNIAHDLTSDIFTNKDGFKSLITNLLHDQAASSNAHCHFQIDKGLLWDLIESHCKVHIYRILQEVFQNINKHANAKNIVLSITKSKTAILIEVSDDGKGFSRNRKSGIGLSNIRTRVATIKGKIEIKSQENIGTNIKVLVPVKS